MPTDLPDDLSILVGPEYAIERELAAGGMSRVFLATERRFGRRVVVKVLADDLREGLSAERFAREITLAARLQHPNIVPLLAAGESSAGAPYYTMPFVDGASLRERLREGPLPLQESVRLLRDAARALAYAHAQGLVHRDIKPENILLSNGAAVVTDFGIAKAVAASRVTDGSTTLTQVGSAIGTPAYMAPEQAAGDAVDHRADLYAWGVVAYELLTGTHPFGHRTTGQALIAAHIAEPPAPLPSTVPPDLATLVLRCLAKTAAERPDSADAVVAGLDGASTLGSESRAIARTMTRRRAWPVLVIVVAALGTVSLWWNSRKGAPNGSSPADIAPIRIAVLPFEHDGPADQEIFAAGLTDALTARLGTLPTLAVIDRRSSAQYRGTTKSAKAIGEELDVRFLLEGVVRWARSTDGTWRAQVIPTLVDVASGTAKWTGEPEIMTPIDPFTAQGEIARRVVDALSLTIAADERQRLSVPATRNPEAFASFTRGRALLDELGRAPMSVTLAERAGVQFRAAVASDSTFGEAWAYLAFTEGMRASALGDADDAVNRARAAAVQALSIAPDHPLVLMMQAMVKRGKDGDRAAATQLALKALRLGASDAMVASLGSLVLDASTVLPALKHAIQLDPRSPLPRLAAGTMYLNLRQWSDSRREARAILALDSTDERGWTLLASEQWLRGDTLAMQRVLTEAAQHIQRPTNELLGLAAYAGGDLRRRYLALSPRELGVSTPFDFIVRYHDNKVDAYLALGDLTRARAHADSIRQRFARGYRASAEILPWKAFANALSGDSSDARRTLDALRAALGAPSVGIVPVTQIGIAGPAIAGTCALLGDTAAAMQAVRDLLAANTGWTARGLAANPKTARLSKLPQFQTLLTRDSRSL